MHQHFNTSNQKAKHNRMLGKLRACSAFFCPILGRSSVKSGSFTMLKDAPCGCDVSRRSSARSCSGTLQRKKASPSMTQSAPSLKSMGLSAPLSPSAYSTQAFTPAMGSPLSMGAASAFAAARLLALALFSSACFVTDFFIPDLLGLPCDPSLGFLQRFQAGFTVLFPPLECLSPTLRPIRILRQVEGSVCHSRPPWTHFPDTIRNCRIQCLKACVALQPRNAFLPACGRKHGGQPNEDVEQVSGEPNALNVQYPHGHEHENCAQLQKHVSRSTAQQPLHGTNYNALNAHHPTLNTRTEAMRAPAAEQLLGGRCW